MRPFQSLRWKLTLSYTGVTLGVLAVVLVILAFVFVPRLQTWMDSQITNGLQEGYTNATFALREFVEREDSAAIQAWLVQRLGRGVDFSSAEAFVIKPDKQIIAKWPDIGLFPVPVDPLFDENYNGMTSQMIPIALNPQTDGAMVGIRYPEREVTLVAPILDSQRRVIGVLVIVGTLVNYLPLLFAVSGAGLAVFAVATLLVGTAFGWFASRGLVRRLKAVTETTEAWGRGDFAHTIPDQSPDEIGQMSRRLNHMAEKLQATIQTRDAFAAAEERKRLARELHDSVKQAVFATAMQLGAARELIERDPPAAKTHLAEAEHLATQARDELTGLIRELRPAALEDRGLAEALREYVADWSRRTHIHTDMRVQGERAVPLEIEQTLFRVAQEALANVARHSSASKAAVELIYNTKSVALGVGDNGRGFEMEALPRAGVGLASMRERMEAVDGHLQIVSRPGAGTHVVASCRYGEGA